MKLTEIKGKFDNSRLSSKTTPTGWRKVRNILGGVALASVLILKAPITIPAGIAVWISYIGTASGAIAGTSHLTKNK